MFEILALNKIAQCGLDQLGENFAVTDSSSNPDGIILRSFNMHDMELSGNIKAVARAGAGVNNIPIDKCTEKGIVVFNTPGANANAVKELVIAGLFLSSRKIVDGISWAKTLVPEGDAVPKLVEKGKGQFAGTEVSGKTLAVIGLGAIGAMVANAAYKLGMDVVGYDPFISIESALHLDRHVHIAPDLATAVASADYITVHVPLNDSTRGQFNKELFAGMKDGVKVLNFARGELVNDADMKEALSSGKVSVYVTDFPNANSLQMENAVCIPHLGASTAESEDNCAKMAARELRNYLTDGNIEHSVNFPDCSMARNGMPRVTIMHKNIPAMISSVTGVMSAAGFNIENILNKSKKELAYTIIDLDKPATDDVIEKVKAIDGVISVRIFA